jgi:hypothetical protein
MHRFCFLLIGSLLVSFIVIPPALAEYPKIYEFFMEAGKKALKAGDYDEALDHFKNAQLAFPSREEPRSYIAVIKRVQDRMSQAASSSQVVPSPQSSYPISESPAQSHLRGVRAAHSQKTVAVTEDPIITSAPARTPDIAGRPGIEAPLAGTVVTPVPEPPFGDEVHTVFLGEEIRATQPGTRLAVQLNSALILEGQNIERFLVITPGFIELRRLDKDRVLIKAHKRGPTFLHLWDDRGRWTFYVEVILPIRRTDRPSEEQRIEEYASPFRLSYSADWSTFYDGPSFDDLSRRSLNLWQWTELAGETPYGYLDSALVATKFRDTTEVSGYTLGLSDGRIGNFRDFNIRGFDVAENFSPLTLPGQYFRGILVESEAFSNNLEWTYLRGRSRGTFGFLSPELIRERDSFFEGAQLTLFPHDVDQYSFNFVRGFGEDRQDFLKDRVYSVEFQKQINVVRLGGELAYDEDSFARTLSSHWGNEGLRFNVSARDIEDDFTTIASLPANRGEVGGIVDFSWDMDHVDLYGTADIYRDRFLSNPDNPDALNYDLSSSVEVPLSPSSRWRNSVYYVYTPGELSPRRNTRMMSNYFKSFEVWGERRLSLSFGGIYQRSRFERAALSEYDRYALISGLRIPLLKGLNYYVNYEYSWVDELASGEQLRPNVFTTGLNYAKEFFENWIWNGGISYRNEENTEGINSFLAGEDSVTGNLGVTYRPSEDLELFVDGRVRNVWAENPENSAFNELAVNAGVRSAWALPFSWNPRGKVSGFVFKDRNGDQHRDPGEEGIAGVTVHVGTQKVTTDADGYYTAVVKAKAVEVRVDIDTVPGGFIFTTPVAARADIMRDQSQTLDFGLSTESGIFGVVFVDENGNRKPDPGEKFISKVRLILDGEQSAVTDFEGIYVFKNIEPGEHTVRLDVNSLPSQYLPLIKLTNRVTVSEGATYVLHVPVSVTSR